MTRRILTVISFLAIGAHVAVTNAQEEIVFSGITWETTGQTVQLTQFDGSPALLLQNARALAKDLAFENGIIEFDIAFPQTRGFAGVGFRAQDASNYEAFYLRSHQSGNPDANQYNPVYHGNSAWQIFYGPRYSAPLHYRFDEWMHVRMVVAGDAADVYLDSAEPVLHIPDLKRDRASGSVMLTSSLVGAYFSKIEVRQTHRFRRWARRRQSLNCRLA